MLEDLNQAVKDYKQKWDRFVAQRDNKNFFGNLKPTGVGWKVQDLAEFDAKVVELREYCDHIHIAWVNERWLGVCHLLESAKLEWGIEIVVIMQRRPTSTDQLGFDHVDFRVPDLALAEEKLQNERNIKWTREKNSEFSEWLSIWFEGTEAKLRSITKIDVGIAELQVISTRMRKQDQNVA